MFQPSSISIHALREEGDISTRSTWYLGLFFIHALREEGDHITSTVKYTAAQIFIHALREEGDIASGARGDGDAILSTPSARRATFDVDTFVDNLLFSIHALREEGDTINQLRQAFQVQFLSTPSARRATHSGTRRPSLNTFLSTPSARRATAKTETKSLFSYKLYNILHEFRRALIYNGSKNYPNHAK